MEQKKAEAESAASVRTAELVTAVVLFLCGALVSFDTCRLGARWAEDGPQAGYFPFYVGLLICIASLVNMVFALRIPAQKNAIFVERGQLKLVLSVLIPSAIFVALVGWLGIYVAGALFVAFFMRWLGKY